MDFTAENIGREIARLLFGNFPMPDLMNPAPGLPHDDFRRTRDEYRRAYLHYRRSHDHLVMMFVSRVSVPAPFAFRDNAAGGGEEGNHAD